ncbi:MAG: ankyrin repeat domain-containing protein [Candidatus Cloacimonetes bacterium]|jgi:ankyrin repeat protein|nr:ankyrin repeat domain-containing protein [Candidatus Cloacimonadota bacterium]
MSMKDLCPEIYLDYPDLHKAVDDDDIVKAIRIIMSGNNPNELNDIDQTPLMLADQFTMAKFLIEHGADVNAIDKYGRSALTHASDPFVVKLLIEEGADLNVVDLDGYSIMDYTIDNYCNGAYKLFLLVQAGAKNNSDFQEGIQGTYDNIMKAPDYRNKFKKLWRELNIDYNKLYRKQLIELKWLEDLRIQLINETR